MLVDMLCDSQQDLGVRWRSLSMLQANTNNDSIYCIMMSLIDNFD